MASFTVIWLLHLNTLHRQQLEFDDRYQYQLHQARVQLFWLAREKPNAQSWLAWQTSLNIQQWLTKLEQHGVTAEVEINPLALVVDIGSQRQASQLSERMVHSTAEGTRLKLGLPENDTNYESELWLDRHYRPHLPMATDLVSNSKSGLNIASLEGEQAYIQQLQAGELDSLHLSGISLDAQYIRHAPTLTLVDLQADDVTNEQIMVTAAEILTADVGSAETALATLDSAAVTAAATTINTALKIMAQQVHIHQPLQLEGDARVRLNTIHSQLTGLEQSIYHCIDESLWCLAPVPPHAIIQSCTNCQLEQQARYFEAVVIINVGVCIHGCGVRVSAPTGVAVTCPAQTVPARQQGQLRCQVSSNLMDVEELKYNLIIDVYSGKDTTVYTRLTVPLHWQVRFLPCTPESHIVHVESSVPSMNYRLELPTYPGGEAYSWGGTVYQECRISSHQTFMRCDINALCSTSGNWHSVVGKCICRGW